MTDRYSCPSIAELWTDEAKLRRWLVAWQAGLAGAGQDERPLLNLANNSSAVSALARESAQLERLFGHDVAAACESVRTRLLDLTPETARWLHYGMCSSDVTDTGLTLTCREVATELYDLGDRATRAVGATGLLDEGRHGTMAVYRTHGQAAQVRDNQWRWVGLARRLDEALKAMHANIPRAVGFLGPTGHGDSGLDRSKVLEVVSSYAPHARLAPRDGSQVRDRQPYVEWLQAVSRLGTACEQFGLTVRLLSQTGIDEVCEGRPATYRGSSSMPHKHNPSRSERLCGLAPVVRGLVSGYAEAASSCWDAHSLEHSSAERVTFPLVTELVGYMLTEVASIAGSLTLNADATRRNVAVAPADSFAAKNALVKSGTDGGTAWSAVRSGVVSGAMSAAIDSLDIGDDPDGYSFPL